MNYMEVNYPISSSMSECLVVDVKLPGSTSAFRVVAIYRSTSVSELSTFNNKKKYCSYYLLFLYLVLSF